LLLLLVYDRVWTSRPRGSGWRPFGIDVEITPKGYEVVDAGRLWWVVSSHRPLYKTKRKEKEKMDVEVGKEIAACKVIKRGRRGGLEEHGID
jgi:hypothetical protein